MAVFTDSYFAPSGTSSNTDVYYRIGAADTGFYQQGGSPSTIWGSAGGARQLCITSTNVGLGDWSSEGAVSGRGGNGLHVKTGTSLQKWIFTSSSGDAGFLGFNAFVDNTNYNLAGTKISTNVDRKITSQYWVLPDSHTSQATTERRLTLQAASLIHGTNSASAGSMSDNQWYMVSNGFMTARATVTAPLSGAAVNALRLSSTVGGSAVSLGPAVDGQSGTWLVSASLTGTGNAAAYGALSVVWAQPNGAWNAGDGAITSIASGAGITLGLSADTQYVTVSQNTGVDQTVRVCAIRLL